MSSINEALGDVRAGRAPDLPATEYRYSDAGGSRVQVAVHNNERDTASLTFYTSGSTSTNHSFGMSRVELEELHGKIGGALTAARIASEAMR